MNKKKLAIICSSAFSLINFRYELICELKKRFYVDTFSENKDQFVQKKLKKIKVNNQSYGVLLKFNFFISQFFSIFNFLYIFYFRKKKYDYYFVYTIKSILFSAFLNFKNSKVIFLVTGLGYLFKNSNNNFLSNSFKSLLILILRLGFKKSNLIFFQNKDDKKVFLKKKLINKNSKVFIMNGSGVNTKKFDYNKKLPKQFTVLMISRIIKDKGIDTYFEAIEILRKKNIDIKFVFCGQTYKGIDSYNFNNFQRKIKKLNIKLILNSKKIKNILINSSVVVLPSPYREGVPRSLLEAISIGRPVIGTKVPGIKEVISHSWNGYLIKKKSSKELANYILKLKGDKKSFNKFCSNSRKLATNKFEVNKVNEVFISNI